MICEYIKLKHDLRVSTGIETRHLEFRGQKTMYPYKGVMIARNNEVCTLEGKLATDSFNLDMIFGDETYQIRFFGKSTNIGAIKSVISMVGQMTKEKSIDAMYETMLPKIFDAFGSQVGELQYIGVKQEGLQSYHYYKLILNGVELNCYIVGHDNREILFCIYNINNQMVATVSKNMIIRHGKSRYTMYISDDKWFKYVAMLTAMIHQHEYDQYDKDGKIGSHVNKALSTFQKGLLDKYQPNFIQSVIDQEGIANLPENMSLVQEKVKESQNTIRIKVHRVVFCLFIFAWVALFIFLFIKSN